MRVPGVHRAEVRCSFDEPMANSSMFVLPRITAPAALQRSMTVGVVGADEVPASSTAGRAPARAEDILLRQRDAGQAGRPDPAAQSGVGGAAWARLFSGSTVMKALSSVQAAMRSR